MSSKHHPLSSLYVLKAFCAFGVVALHTRFGVATEYVRHIAGITVPVFFMITGYFLYGEDRTQVCSRLRASVGKVIPIILILQVFYYMLGPIEGSFSETYMLYFKWIFMGQNPNGGHLWYLTALLQGLLTLWLFVYFIGERWVWVLIPLWGLEILQGEYRFLLFGQESSMMSANFIFYALPCLAMGFVIHRHEARFLSVFSCWKYVYVGAVALSLFNSFVLPIACERLSVLLHPWLRIAMILSVFLSALETPGCGRGSLLERIGKEFSGNIYYWHGLFVFVFARVPLPSYDELGTIYVFILSWIVAYVVVGLQNKLKVSVLR